MRSLVIVAALCAPATAEPAKPETVAKTTVKGIGPVALELTRSPEHLAYAVRIAKTWTSEPVEIAKELAPRATLSAVTIDGRPAAVAVIELHYNHDGERWSETVALACGVDVLGSTRCVKRNWAASGKSCTVQVKPDGVVVPTCGARETLSIDAGAIDAAMDEALRDYDRGDYATARAKAEAVLAKQPDNVRMLRLAVSVACIDGSADTAKTLAKRLPPPDRKQMAVRCSRYGVTLE